MVVGVALVVPGPGATGPSGAAAQVEARAELQGEVVKEGTPVDEGTVTLHRVTADSAGEVSRTPLGADGRFSFVLPRVPDPGGHPEVYFASIRHHGILYFGGAVTRSSQLDSLYRIQVYDTTAAPAGGASLPVAVRNLFLEREGQGEGAQGPWRVVDLIQVRNEGSRTVVAPRDGATWSYPLPPQARDIVVGDSDLAPDAVSFVEGTMRVEAPIPPGERTYLVRYRIPSLEMTLPLPGTTNRLELLVREPAPPMEAPGLARGEAVEMEPGSTYRRYAAGVVSNRVVELAVAEPRGGPDVRWIAAALALVLAAAGGIAVVRTRTDAGTDGRPVPAPDAPEAREERRTVLLRIARLDDAFQALDDPSPEERRRYREERRALLTRLDDVD